jgi:hypothetical protein
MKLFAARAEIDAEDIALLYRQLGFTTVHVLRRDHIADSGLTLTIRSDHAGVHRLPGSASSVADR